MNITPWLEKLVAKNMRYVEIVLEDKAKRKIELTVQYIAHMDMFDLDSYTTRPGKRSVCRGRCRTIAKTELRDEIASAALNGYRVVSKRVRNRKVR